MYSPKRTDEFSIAPMRATVALKVGAEANSEEAESFSSTLWVAAKLPFSACGAHEEEQEYSLT
jgi:hypothetical protein